ncbi:cell division protein FtsW [Marinicauda salina]|uniref:Probable peptidoglycan glycosyltransferase FtsW n=1 Tax=Marinicauda salina TaxID=2135793 RepID=A0A2U2BUQ5_9PROT|nr:putative peptidoglycan glycosyltransferase FtsW [Marinicauda salina]PWE17719.1 cell division protein FtsW [Marinicauda salina]
MIVGAARRAPLLWSGLDRTLMFTVLALIFIGLTLSLAASPAAAERLALTDPFYFLYRHGAFAALAALILAGTAALSPVGARRAAGLVLVGSLLAMIAIPFVGADVNGATRWLRLGGFSLQPSELFKPAFIVIAAWLFAEESRGAPVPGRLIAAGIYALAVLLLLGQPDFGQTVLLSLIFGGMLWVSGLSYVYTAVLGGLGAAGAGLAYFMLPHVRDRIADFLSPGGERMQTETALEAIGRGGLFGTGPGEGEVKRLLPEAHTDFVFSVAAEEFGLLASLAIIAFFAILFLRAWTNARRLTDHFAQLATAGLAMLFAAQALINIAVNLNLVPPKGMTLPFVSYGGSSMLGLAFAAGLLLALTRRRPGAYQRRGLTT